jgi:hypothetical protein
MDTTLECPLPARTLPRGKGRSSMRRMSPRRIARIGIVVILLLGLHTASPLPAPAVAQDQNNPDVLKKELADSLAQLKAAQDRKNELATENEKLKAQMAAMQKDLDECRRAQATWSEQSYFLRVQHAAWDDFLDRYPRLKAEWEVFLSAGPFAAPNDLPQWANPLAVIATTQNGTPSASAPAATTAPATTSVPATTTTAPATTTVPATATVPATSNGTLTTQPTTKG